MSHLQALGEFERDSAFWQEQPFAGYQPQWAVEQESDSTLWLTDRGRRVALVNQQDRQIDLFEFEPGRPRVPQAQRPALYHAPSLLGARLTLGQWLAGAPRRTSDHWALDRQARPDGIRLVITEQWEKADIHARKQLELRVDPRLGYVLYTADKIEAASPVAIEFFNFLVKGLTHHDPAKRRFPLLVWHSPRAGMLKWASNLVALRCPGHLDKEFARNLGTNGWVGFLGEPDWNPVFALRDANQPCHLVTCDNLLDEHLCFSGPPPRTTPDRQRWSCTGALFSLPGRVADRLAGQARFNELRAAPALQQVRPFCLNQLCDFETCIPLAAYFRGAYWWVVENGADWATVSDEKAHSGRWALRLRVRREDAEKSLHPLGSSMWLDGGRSYRLSAWVCYTGRSPGQFRLAASQAYYTWAESREPKEARFDAKGSTEWNRLELTFRALSNDPCVFVQLIASGHGQWFVDDILLEEIKTFDRGPIPDAGRRASGE